MVEDKYKIKLTPISYEDLDEIYDYIVNDLHNEVAADNLLDNIETNIMRLRDFPFSCSFVRNEILKDKGYRKLIVDNYIVFHQVREAEKEVVIMVYCTVNKSTKT
ncbi:type II toxin-antitoxin system RelE/ParE family toxin [Alkalihalobacterium alkalinitrilicum]|uniref:type II toxin-antitoxin system RelE/ParE family toxin n=1 Tax=Alkalihalobacterium alkalinitrilicum TaxID=427920 RepID=UPI001C598382|nr:type II toxin-antitoxin system RelE/ParE family toxin [Alkalihalobacterium alkalinitrilicum]